MDDQFRKLLESAGTRLDKSSFETNPPLKPSPLLVRRFHEQTLNVDELEDVRYLIATFWEWHKAYCDYLKGPRGSSPIENSSLEKAISLSDMLSISTLAPELDVNAMIGKLAFREGFHIGYSDALNSLEFSPLPQQEEANKTVSEEFAVDFGIGYEFGFKIGATQS